MEDKRKPKTDSVTIGTQTTTKLNLHFFGRIKLRTWMILNQMNKLSKNHYINYEIYQTK